MLTGYSVVQYQEISCLSLPYLRHQLPYFNFSRGLGVAKKSRKIEGKKSLGALENESYLFFGETMPLIFSLLLVQTVSRHSCPPETKIQVGDLFSRKISELQTKA